MQTEIIEWRDEFARDFIDLSVEWLKKYVRVEPADEAILYHPYEAILNRGGMIFFARLNGKSVGTVSMMNLGKGVFELAKLAVTEACKGRHVGDQLMDTALSFARARGGDRVILFTNSSLLPAIHLYRKYGFKEVPLVDNEYEESDMKMELKL